MVRLSFIQNPLYQNRWSCWPKVDHIKFVWFLIISCPIGNNTTCLLIWIRFVCENWNIIFLIISIFIDAKKHNVCYNIRHWEYLIININIYKCPCDCLRHCLNGYDTCLSECRFFFFRVPYIKVNARLSIYVEKP